MNNFLHIIFYISNFFDFFFVQSSNKILGGDDKPAIVLLPPYDNKQNSSFLVVWCRAVGLTEADVLKDIMREVDADKVWLSHHFPELVLFDLH